MHRVLKYYYPLLLLFLQAGILTAQDQQAGAGTVPGGESLITENTGNYAFALFSIRNIIITGNKKTKPEIILRELPFRKGDRMGINELTDRMERGRQLLMNMSLFHEAQITLRTFDGNMVDISISVSERWYIFPIPYFKPVDRNLNQWLFEKDASLKRTNFGAKVLYNNITGHNDKLRLMFITGYANQTSVSYERPYIDKSMRWGLKISSTAGRTKEINYGTLHNKQLFLKGNQYLYSYFRNNLELTYRRAIRAKHKFGININSESTRDTVLALNPAYFPKGRKSISYPEFYYIIQYTDQDYNPYPTKGYAAEATFFKRGLNRSVNMWQISAKGSASWPLSSRSFVNLKSFASIKLPFRQPFTGQQMLGYSDVFMQGYEYYVIDGVAAAYLKASITRRLFNFNINLPANRLVENKKIPFRIYGKVFGNTGYVHHPEPGSNRLANQILCSAGLGLDIVTMYDFTLKLEWTFNQLGQNGLFLHKRSTF